MSERLGKVHFWGSITFITIVFCTMFIMGYAGMPRRYYDHTSAEYLRDLQHLNVFATWSAFALGAFQLIFVFNFIKSRWWGKPAPKNPWDVGTLDWTIETPVPHYNFKTIPVVQCGPHEFSNPVLGPDTDWIYQTEKLPD